MERTISTFSGPHTPVTRAPNACAICTANGDAPVVAQGLKGGQAGVGDGRRLFEGEVRGLRRELVLRRARVLGVRADAEHLIAGPQTGHVPSEGLHDPGHVHARHGVLRGAEAVAEQAYQVRQARHEVPHARGQ